MLVDATEITNQLALRLHAYKPSFQELPLPENLKHDDRWVAASALQKAIRRGQVAEAYRAAQCLNKLNPSQLWTRLRTIAGEDIGISDFRAVYETWFLSGKKQWRLDHGGEDFVLAYAIENLCKADKTRSADDLLYCCDTHPNLAEAREQLSGMTPDQLYHAVLHENRSIYEQMIAAWYLHGTAYHRPVNMVRKKGDPCHLLDIFSQTGMPEYAFDTIRLGLTKTDGHAIAMGFSFMALAKSKTSNVIDECNTPSQRIGEWNSEAWDRHVRDGNYAFRKFLMICPEIKSFLKLSLPDQSAANVIGWCVFALEGQLLDRRIRFDGSEDIRQRALEAWLQGRKMNSSLRNDLLALVKENIHHLYEARVLATASMATNARSADGAI